MFCAINSRPLSQLHSDCEEQRQNRMEPPSLSAPADDRARCQVCRIHIRLMATQQFPGSEQVLTASLLWPELITKEACIAMSTNNYRRGASWTRRDGKTGLSEDNTRVPSSWERRAPLKAPEEVGLGDPRGSECVECRD